MNLFVNAFAQLGRTWNDYWFTARNTADVARLRVGVSFVALVQFVVYFFYGASWIGRDGWLNKDAGLYLIGNGVPGTGSEYRWSPLFVWDSPFAIQTIAVVGIVASLLLLLGIGSRLTAFITWFTIVAFQHRAPMLAVPSDALLSAALLYLILDTGRRSWQIKPGFSDGALRVSSNLVVRLFQVHMILWVAFSCMNMLGNPVWWNGEAVAALTGQGVGYIGAFDAKSWYGQLLTHAVIGVQIFALVGMLSKNLQWLGGLAVGCFAVLVLLITADWMYAATLVALSVSFFVGTFLTTSSSINANRNQ